MSWRQAVRLIEPLSRRAPYAAERRTRLLLRGSGREGWQTNSVLNVGDLRRPEPRQELPGPLRVEARVGGLDAEEVAVLRRRREARRVEHRVVRRGQPVEREHSEHRRHRRAKDGALERRWHERRPREDRLATDVE